MKKKSIVVVPGQLNFEYLAEWLQEFDDFLLFGLFVEMSDHDGVLTWKVGVLLDVGDLTFEDGETVPDVKDKDERLGCVDEMKGLVVGTWGIEELLKILDIGWTVGIVGSLSGRGRC